jgi:hypothetical protein
MPLLWLKCVYLWHPFHDLNTVLASVAIDYSVSYVHVFTAWRRHVIWNNTEHLSQFTLHVIMCTVNGMFYHREKDSQPTFTKKKDLLYFFNYAIGYDYFRGLVNK